MNTTAARHLVTIVPTSVSGHACYLATCDACRWQDAHVDEAEAIRLANRHEAAAYTA